MYRKITKKQKTGLILLILAGVIVLGLIIYQLPPVKSRLSWRIEYALIYLRGVFNPVEGVPTAVSNTQFPTATQFPTSTPVPATSVPELTPTSAPTPTPLPLQVFLPSPAVELEDLNACGPARLAMYLRYWGWQGDQFTISDVIKPIRADRNVNVEELIYYSRNFTGWLNTEYRVGGNLTMLRQLLSGGIPVMIEGSFILPKEFWPNDDKWAGHYLLVNGYDDTRQAFLVQDSEHGADQMVPYDVLETDWQSFNYVYILIYPPEKQEMVKAILGIDWDPNQNRRNALSLAQAQTEKDPNNAYAWFNLGTNLVYFDQHADAVVAYDRARAIGLPQRMLRYQFGPFISYFNALHTDDLLALTEYALERTPNSEEAMLWRGWALYRQGKKAEALESFQQALEAHPGYHDAVYAIDYVQTN